MMLHLQSLQLASLRSFSLTLILRLMKLSQKIKSLREQFSRNSSQTEAFAKSREATYGRINAVTISYLIGQISNLALQSLDLPPQVFFFLIHSLSVTPLFSEVLLKNFDLKLGHINEEYIPLLPQKP